MGISTASAKITEEDIDICGSLGTKYMFKYFCVKFDKNAEGTKIDYEIDMKNSNNGDKLLSEPIKDSRTIYQYGLNVTIRHSPYLCFCTVTVKVSCEEQDDIEKSATGFIIGKFVYLNQE